MRIIDSTGALQIAPLALINCAVLQLPGNVVAKVQDFGGVNRIDQQIFFFAKINVKKVYCTETP